MTDYEPHPATTELIMRYGNGMDEAILGGEDPTEPVAARLCELPPDVLRHVVADLLLFNRHLTAHVARLSAPATS